MGASQADPRLQESEVASRSPCSSRAHQLGVDAEDAAAEHLRCSGWSILARNWRAAGAELDIVVRRRGVLAFVEVKARSWGHPHGLASVDGRKRYRLQRVACAWLDRYAGPFTSCTFVVASMVPTVDGWDMEWLFDAFDV